MSPPSTSPDANGQAFIRTSATGLPKSTREHLAPKSTITSPQADVISPTDRTWSDCIFNTDAYLPTDNPTRHVAARTFSISLTCQDVRVSMSHHNPNVLNRTRHQRSQSEQ